ncbi:MAG: dTDP-4-dehydrorhamnose reductase [Luteitalea sp.]|nr:dTDP-4-dehydrorhamnose reductase [Luteitalea sp.]
MILVLGAAGQLGATIVERLRRRTGAPEAAALIALTRRELDVADARAVGDAIRRHGPALIVNCTAYNDVDGAEEDATTALSVNAFAVQAMARGAAEVDATLVHYSTDFVFDGETDRPYREEDRARPLSAYGASKLLGEWFAADAPRHYVLRVESLFGGPAARSSFDKIIAGLVAGRDVAVFSDRIVSPSYVEHVADATLALVSRRAAGGVYHCVNTGATTWYDAARHIATRLGAPQSLLKPVSINDVTLRARRPRYCALANEKLRRAGVSMPRWEDALTRYVDKTLPGIGS